MTLAPTSQNLDTLPATSYYPMFFDKIVAKKVNDLMLALTYPASLIFKHYLMSNVAAVTLSEYHRVSYILTMECQYKFTAE